MSEPDASINDAPNFKPFGVAVVALSLGLLAFLWGKSVGADKSARAASPPQPSPPSHDASEDHLSRAARIAHDQLRNLGVPSDRYLLSVEAFHDKERKLWHLARIWPPWSVSQPQDSTPPLMWRAIVVDSQSRCRLTAINDPGTLLTDTVFEQPRPLETEPRVESLTDAVTPAPKRRHRIIMAPPPAYGEKPVLRSASGRRLVILPPPAPK